MSRRLFVALDVPLEVKYGLQDLRIFIPGARWMEINQLHLTLHFLGDIHRNDFSEIEQTLTQVTLPAFELTLNGVGSFHSAKETKVLWAGVEKNPKLEQLQKKIESILLPYSVNQEKRKFTPHITLARLKNVPAAKIGLFLQYFNLYKSLPFTISQFHLYSSCLGADQTYYEKEATYELFPTLNTSEKRLQLGNF